MYFLDILFGSLNINVKRNDLNLMEDMNRLAFFTTKCETMLSEQETDVPLWDIKSKDFCGEDFYLIYHLYANGRAPMVYLLEHSFSYKKKDVFATNKNSSASLVIICGMTSKVSLFSGRISRSYEPFTTNFPFNLM